MFVADPSGRRPTHRRQWLLNALALAVVPVGLAAFRPTAHAEEPNAGEPAAGIRLRPANHDLYHVRIELEVEGNVQVAKNPLVSRTADLKLPLRSQAVLEFEERYRRPSGADGSDYVTALERFYHRAESNSTVNRRAQTCSLRPSVQSTIVRRELLPEVIYGVEDFLDRDELDLLRTPISSAGVEELLPRQAVDEGDTYEVSADQMMSVLNLSSAQSSDVSASVGSISPTEVRIQFRGDVQGSVDGVPTVIRCAGKLTYNREQQLCTWLAIAIHETREIGKAEPGFDVAGTIKLARKPLAHPTALPPEPQPLDLTGPIPSDRLYIAVDSDQLGIHALVDRRWRIMTDIPGAAMMRMIDNERTIAQCDFRPLAALEPGHQWTVEAFQADVKRTLGDQLTAIVGADEQLSDAGLRVMRVIAQGAAENVPVQWIVLHFSDDSGRRVLATFTMEADHAEAFDNSDEQLASTLRFAAPDGAAEDVAAATAPGGAPKSAAARASAVSASDRR